MHPDSLAHIVGDRVQAIAESKVIKFVEVNINVGICSFDKSVTLLCLLLSPVNIITIWVTSSENINHRETKINEVLYLKFLKEHASRIRFLDDHER